MKKIIRICILFLFITGNIVAQRIPPTYGNTPHTTYTAPEENEDVKGFNKKNVFTGGNISVGFASGQTAIGATPELGYSFNKWVDAGIIVNLNYSSIAAEYNNGYNQRAFNYGIGAFGRVYPFNPIFLTLQPEQNWVNYREKNIAGVVNSLTTNATSMIAGIGYGQRTIGQSGYYFLIGIDLLRNINSPYVDISGTPIPIVKAGFNFYLK